MENDEILKKVHGLDADKVKRTQGMENEILKKVPWKYVNLWYKEKEHGYRIMTIANGVVEVNDIPAFIWSRIDGKHTVEAIVDELHDRFGNVPLESIQRDVCNVIGQFVKMEVVTVSWHEFKEG